MQIVVWDKSIQDKNLKKVLRSLVDNVPEGWVTSIEEETEYKRFADVDVIFGSWKDYDVEHHNLKRQVVKNSKNVVVIETPLIGRGPVHEVLQHRWFRVGLNGFMSTADYPPISEERLSQIKTIFSLPDETVRKQNGDYILIPLQLPGDASLQSVNITQWAADTVSKIREFTSRKIVLRTPQLERNFNLEPFKEIPEIYFQKGKYDNLQVTLDCAYAVVTYSSGMSVESLLNGNRTFVDSNWGFKSPSQGSLKEVFDKDYINFQTHAEYQNWLYEICSTQWSAGELKKGLYWKAVEENKCLNVNSK